jgi:hypothetical protein
MNAVCETAHADLLHGHVATGFGDRADAMMRDGRFKGQQFAANIIL